MIVLSLASCAAPTSQFEELLRAAKLEPTDFAELGDMILNGPAGAGKDGLPSTKNGSSSSATRQYFCNDPCCDGAIVGGAGSATAAPPPRVLSEAACTSANCLGPEFRQVVVEFQVCPAMKQDGQALSMLMAPLDSTPGRVGVQFAERCRKGELNPVGVVCVVWEGKGRAP